MRGPAAGPLGVLTLVPEAILRAGGRMIVPVAVIEIGPRGVRRHTLRQSVTVRRHGDAADGRGPHGPPAATGADTWIVAGHLAPEPDPRLAAAFGPVQVTARGVQIPLARVEIGAGGMPLHSIPLGFVRVADGAVSIHLHPTQNSHRIRWLFDASALLALVGIILCRRGRRQE